LTSNYFNKTNCYRPELQSLPSASSCELQTCCRPLCYKYNIADDVVCKIASTFRKGVLVNAAHKITW